jgi:hypothetical protein
MDTQSPTVSRKQPNLHGHLMTDKAPPTQDDDGDWGSYAKCSRCGAVENTDESIKDCPNKLKVQQG